MSDRDPCQSPGRRRTSETSSVSACEALIASNGSRDHTRRAAKFLPDSFQSVLICFKMFHHCCFALPARIIFAFKIVIVPSTTLSMTHNLSFQGVLGGTLKSVDCQSFLLRSAVSFLLGQTRAPRMVCSEWLSYDGTRGEARRYPYHHHIIFTQLFHTTVSHHYHIIIIMTTITTRPVLDVGSFLPPSFLHLFLALHYP